MPGLLDKVKGLTFHTTDTWDDKIGDLGNDGTADTTGNVSNILPGKTPNKTLEAKWNDEIDYDNMGPDGLSVNSLREEGIFGADAPFVTKKLNKPGEQPDGELPNGAYIEPFLARLLKTPDALVRLTKNLTTPKGVAWIVKQGLLQRTNSMRSTRNVFIPPIAAITSATGLVSVSRMDNNINPFDTPAQIKNKQYGENPTQEDEVNPEGHYKLQNLLKSSVEDSEKTDGGFLSKLKNIVNGDRDANYNPSPPRHATGVRDIELLGDGTTFETTKNVKPIGNTGMANSLVNSEGKYIQAAKHFGAASGNIKTLGDNLTQVYSRGFSNQLQVPYGGTYGEVRGDKLPKDFIKFRIRDAVNGKWLVFPAHLGTVTDTVTPEYTQERYIGRPDAVHIYSGTNRSVSFDFKVAAFTKQEIPIIQEKMNYLVGLGYPTFKPLSTDTEMRPVTPYVYLTIGDMFNNTPGYFSNISLTVEENSVWELDDGYQIPQYFNVNCEFVYIGKYLPHTIGKHYEVPFLKDVGVGENKFGTFGDKDPKVKSTVRPKIGNPYGGGAMQDAVHTKYHASHADNQVSKVRKSAFLRNLEKQRNSRAQLLQDTKPDINKERKLDLSGTIGNQRSQGPTPNPLTLNKQNKPKTFKIAGQDVVDTTHPSFDDFG